MTDLPFAPLAEVGVPLTQDEVTRYSRHLILPEIGVSGQRRLKNSRVLVVGAGGLGSPALLYLAAAGVGTLGLVDFDEVDTSNLQRQVIHGVADVGRLKVDSAIDRIAEINPLVRVEAHRTRLSSANALDIIADYEVVVDGTDNFATRYLVNDACVLTHKPYLWGSIFRFEGQVSVFWADKGPCYRCLFPEPPPPGMVPSCAEGGVLGVLCASIGAVQATEAIKLLVGAGRTLVGRLQVYNALEMQWRELGAHADNRCPACGEHPSITELIDYEQFCGVAPAPRADPMEAIGVAELRDWLDERESGTRDFVLIDVREPQEREINEIPGSILIPKREFDSGAVLETLPADKQLVLYCKSGARSAACVSVVRDAGLQAVNLAGGVSAWVTEIDPAQNSY